VRGTYICVSNSSDLMLCFIEAGNITVTRAALRRMMRRGWCHAREDGDYRLQICSNGEIIEKALSAHRSGIRKILEHYRAAPEVMDAVCPMPTRQTADIIFLDAWRSEATKKVAHGG